ncbi:MAG: RdgB/HAM1 family non-canonical purine NTP pyrophosphatase [Chloroflexi bacterium]|nr:RdgB/HAM1 family non-canonical purine NTP pyrophosphatase [Chloroflexota bacterium]MBU1751020.1 RdgB/HAM1 family non-canonical purine NTP pyrophosphatase [Chloroflexota bacterium]
MPSRLLVATNNLHKLDEYRDILAGLPLDLITLADVGINADVPETGDTFEANAVQKAAAYARMSGLLTLADDSGLVVDALGGEPGVYSARWGGRDMPYPERHRRLQQLLADVPWAQRKARFVCVIALVAPGGSARTVEGVCEGFIAHEPRGTGGFGYDPMFYLPEYDCTMAELPAEVKNRISHRGRAGAAARALLTVGEG